jgi:uncharacterized membrane protein
MSLSSGERNRRLNLPEQASWWIMVLEMVFILAPVSLFYLLGVSVMCDAVTWSTNPNAKWSAVITLLCAIPLICVWRVVITFALDGLENVRSMPRYWWLGIWAGAVIIGLSLVAMLFANTPAISTPGIIWSDLALLVLGAPVLIPVIHVVLEMTLRRP